MLPAIGGSAANMLAYDQAKKFSRHPERFGTGVPEGIIASESSNNANVGGSLVTIMAFGIPGDAVTAVWRVRLCACQGRIPAGTLILGLILGDQIEINLIRAIMTDDNLLLFFTRPISCGLRLCAALSVGLAVWQHVRHRGRTAREEAHDF